MARRKTVKARKERAPKPSPHKKFEKLVEEVNDAFSEIEDTIDSPGRWGNLPAHFADYETNDDLLVLKDHIVSLNTVEAAAAMAHEAGKEAIKMVTTRLITEKLASLHCRRKEIDEEIKKLENQLEKKK